jgi:hypothetical protein
LRQRRLAGLCTQCPKKGPIKPVFKGGLCEEHYLYVRAKNNERYAQSEGVRRKNGDRCRRNSYGISADEYDMRFAEQGGVCAICRQPETQLGGRRGTTRLSLAVDHDHASGRVRGLLCRNCNRGLGYFNDSPDRLRAAAAYLEAQREVGEGDCS